jgi:RNA polymerase sigma factor (sigma-70 family)
MPPKDFGRTRVSWIRRPICAKERNRSLNQRPRQAAATRFHQQDHDLSASNSSSIALGAIESPAEPTDPFPYTGAEAVAFDPDRDLVDQAGRGDREAFEALLRRHYDRIHRVAWRLTGSGADAEDIAQEVCCTLVEKIGSFKGEARFTTWLTGIVVNACRDHRRRGVTLIRLRTRLSVLAGLAARPDGRDAYRRSWLASELARLDPLLRDTVVLVVGEDLTHAEAARALGVAESTVSWRMHEARRQLTPKTTKDAPDGL